MRNLLFVFYVVLVWVLSMVNASGLGIAYNTPAITNVLILLWFVIFVNKRVIKRAIDRNPVLALFTIISFIIFPVLIYGSWEGLSYLMMLPMVYCFSEQKVSDKLMKISGYVVAGLGLLILYIYNTTIILSGWNDNHISMIGLFSYAYYSISLYGNMSGRKLTVGLLISLLYLILLFKTESRSSSIFIVLALILAYSGNLFRKILAKRSFVFFALNVPLLVSLVCIFLPELFIFQYFDEWSLEHYDKTALNGRDELWIEAYDRLFDTYLIGEGEFLINHHNSAVAVISVFGVIGYLCWYKIFAKPISFMCRYASDNLMFGFISSFFLIFWQQSFELGFVNSTPNMIPYMILGLGLARARDLQRHLHSYVG